MPQGVADTFYIHVSIKNTLHVMQCDYVQASSGLQAGVQSMLVLRTIKLVMCYVWLLHITVQGFLKNFYNC